MGIDRMSTAARIDELLSKFDENPRRYFAPLANEYRKAGDLTQAIALCREHLPKQPGHMSGHIVFGQALYEYGDLVEAQTVFEAALALDPENLIALRHLGDIARGRGDSVSARRWYGRVLEADPRNDDIAALLASLPSRATPIATPVVPSQPSPVVEEPSSQARSFIDEPAWHTPAILGAPVEPVHQEIEARPEPDLLDLDSPGEPMIEVPAFLGDGAIVAETVDTEPLDEAFGAEPEMSAVFDARDPEAQERAPVEEVAFEELQIEEVDNVAVPFGNASVSPDDELLSVSPHDSLSDAIGAFATHDPLDSVSAPVGDADQFVSPVEPVEAERSATAEPTPAPSERVAEYGDGLEDLEWPDASQLAVRPPSPARSVTPIDAWPAIAAQPAFDEIESLVDVPADMDDAPLQIESLVEAPLEEFEEPTTAVESLVEAPVEEFEEPTTAVESLVEAPVEEFEEPTMAVESLVEAPVEEFEEPTTAVESLVEAPVEEFEEPTMAVESLVEAPVEEFEEPTTAVESLVEAPVEEFEEPTTAVESLLDASVELDEPPAVATASLLEAFGEDTEVSVEAELTADALLDAPVAPEFLEEPAVEAVAEEVTQSDVVLVHGEPSAPIDEDPPFSAGEMPWLMATEEEREAEEADVYEVSSELPESPAFVTETMAELFVAQGFVARAIGVYEELVVRRPDDMALASRLAALQASLDAEPVASALSVTAPDDEAPAEQPFSSTPSAPLAAFTPARSSTPRAVPFIAPAPRRTAREWLSLLAAMQVARRTPVAGHVVVSMPTPADGLASLFGSAPLPIDDVAARSLATAYGGAVPLDSSTPLFASGEFTLPTESPREPVSAAPTEPASGSGVYSFDRFFPDPATTANGPSASSDAPTATSPSSAAPDDPTSPGADLAQFSHWLKGLSNS